MNSSIKFDTLNKKQLIAVTLEDNTNTLILAGAGSGKTRVLTHRIQYLVSAKKCSPESILAVTFTNKAAHEMRERLGDLLLRPVGRMWVGTFHSLAHRVLREHSIEANLSPNFQILDQQDQYQIIKRLMKENSIDDTKLPIRKVQWFINKQKDEGIKVNDIDAGYNLFVKQSVKVFALYEGHCQANDLVDFAGLLAKNYELLKNNNSLLEYYQKQFRHILVDEFQDTNTVQYQWIKLLYNGNNNIFCVGDDDQSIYGWRGAKIENIQKIEQDFQPIKIIKLEQNYRSTGNILSASNALIANNKNRMDKSLWTKSGNGDLIDVYNATTENEEARHITDVIKNTFNQGQNLSENAILYRANAQSRVFEEALIKRKIDYQIYGGLRFFERAEIKNAMSYVRLIEDQNDNVAFERIVNFPARGIGLATVEKIRDYSLENHTSLFNSVIAITDSLSTRAANSLRLFIEMIESIVEETKNLTLSEKVAAILIKSSLIDYYSKDKTDKSLNKKENLEELVNAAQQYTHDEENELNETQGFIVLATLDTSGESSQQKTDCVQLMTIHSAKGLEFSTVFLVGMEELLFPSIQSQDEPHLMDEERRLCYVGMTRAMKKLSLSYADKRFIHGQSFYPIPSRFLDEIPDAFLNHIQSTHKHYNYGKYIEHTGESNKNLTRSNSTYSIGQSVKHTKFGLGTILNYEGSGDNTRVQVEFNKAGTKWLITSYANLELT